MSPNFGSQQELEGSEGSEDEVHDRRWGLEGRASGHRAETKIEKESTK